MKICISENPKEEAAAVLAGLFNGYRDVPVLFLSSGGSALDLLSPEILPSDCSRFTISVLDEHYTENAPDRNFFKLMQLKFYETAKERGAASFDPYDGAVESAGKRFDAFLKNWVATHPAGKVVATVGIGTDGHTAGIVPFQDAKLLHRLFETDGTLAVGYTTDYGPFPERVTSTFELLRQASDVIIFATGAEKADMLKQLMRTKAPPSGFPAMFLRQLAQATLVTDIAIDQ